MGKPSMVADIGGLFIWPKLGARPILVSVRILKLQYLGAFFS